MQNSNSYLFKFIFVQIHIHPNSYLSIFPDDKADIFAASLVI